MTDLLSTGISGLLSFRRGLDTTANNIANANTPGYTRQVAEFDDLPGQTRTYGYVGNGVQVTTIRRVYDQFLNLQLQSSLASESRLSTMDGLASQVDELLADPQTGLSPRLQGFFDAIQDVSNDPSSVAARQALLGEARNLVTRFEGIDARLGDLDAEVNGRLRESVSEINRLSDSIATLNDEIVVAGSRTGQPPNGLLDERDALLRELSSLIDISTVPQDDGALNVFIGSGQSLVLGIRSESLAAVPDEFDPTRLRVVYRTAGGDAPLPSGSLGGAIGGMQEFRDRVLDPTRAALGETALALALSVNEQQAQGMDLTGNLGAEFFSIEDPTVLTSQFNAGTGSATVGYADVGALRDADYVLAYDGSNYSLTRSDTGQAVPMTGSGSALDPFLADGLEIVVGGAPAAGDRLQILGSRGAAGRIGVSLSDPQSIAAAAPTRTSGSAANLGDATIGTSETLDASDPDLLSTAVIEFTSPTSYTINGAGSFSYVSGDPIVVNGSRFTISGNPVVGDQFTLEANFGGSGDNRNALELAELQRNGILEGGTVSISNNYAGLVAEVGNNASQIKANLSAQTVLLRNVESNIASKSGVNLDEEAANLLRFQQAYEAAAQVIAVTDTLFNTLLAAVRR
jgi:flagellar hook-associated protein 1 FlgK